MRPVAVPASMALVCLLSAATVHAQSTQSSATPAVPRVMHVAGVFQPADGEAVRSVETVTVAIYEQEKGGTPLWEETQQVVVDSNGRYAILLGAARPDGLPLDLFASGEARWLGRRFERGGEREQPRVLLASVPYALKASDTDTLRGRPASDYQLAGSVVGGAATSSAQSLIAGPLDILPGAVNNVPKYVSTTDLSLSSIFDIGGLVGVGTASPADTMHLKFTNTTGTMTGLTVQNMGNTASSYSGMLFYDQNGALAQFQGFNNSTHEYRINNIAPSGSINFMIGSTSRLFVNSNGRVGIGTATPDSTLRVAGNTSENALYVTSPGGGRHGIRVDDAAGSAALVTLNNPNFLDVFANAAMIAYGGGAATGIITESETGDGVVGSSTSGLAGHFFGNVLITGTLAKGGGSFKIDHPLDPANKYLSHSCGESPDMMNIYNGNVTLDASGEAVVMLPAWFEALNRDFRYQLTALGAPAPNLYIAEEIANGRFKIGGGSGGCRVSWQVTGVRHDAFADAHRIAIEEDKPATERGHYLYPELYGQSPDTRIGPGTTVKKKDQ